MARQRRFPSREAVYRAMLEAIEHDPNGEFNPGDVFEVLGIRRDSANRTAMDRTLKRFQEQGLISHVKGKGKPQKGDLFRFSPAGKAYRRTGVAGVYRNYLVTAMTEAHVEQLAMVPFDGSDDVPVLVRLDPANSSGNLHADFASEIRRAQRIVSKAFAKLEGDDPDAGVHGEVVFFIEPDFPGA